MIGPCLTGVSLKRGCQAIAVIYGCLTIFYVILFVVDLKELQEEIDYRWQQLHNETDSAHSEEFQIGTTGLTVLGVLIGVFTLLNLLFASILFAAATKENVRCLKIWLWFEAISLIIVIAGLIMEISVGIGLEIGFETFLEIGWSIYTIWVVYTFMNGLPRDVPMVRLEEDNKREQLV